MSTYEKYENVQWGDLHKNRRSLKFQCQSQRISITFIVYILRKKNFFSWNKKYYIPIFFSRLVIADLTESRTAKDLAEQCIKVLELICTREAGAVFEAGGLTCVLGFIRDNGSLIHKDTLHSAMSVVSRLCTKMVIMILWVIIFSWNRSIWRYGKYLKKQLSWKIALIPRVFWYDPLKIFLALYESLYWPIVLWSRLLVYVY